MRVCVWGGGWLGDVMGQGGGCGVGVGAGDGCRGWVQGVAWVRGEAMGTVYVHKS